MLTYPLPVVFLLFVSNHLAIRWAVLFFESGYFSISPKPDSGECVLETGEYTREAGEYMQTTQTNTFHGSMLADFNFQVSICETLCLVQSCSLYIYIYMVYLLQAVLLIDLTKAAFGRNFQTRASVPNSGEYL